MPYSDEDAYHHEVPEYTPEDLAELEAIINRAAIHGDEDWPEDKGDWNYTIPPK